MIFITHYSELLDDFERGDQIYIALRKPQTSLVRFSETPMRADISKTEVFVADNLEGTSPTYDAYIALLEKAREVVNGSK